LIEKFTYFDFLTYLLPGTILEFALLGAWAAAKLPLPQFTGEGGLLGSIVFILVAFILGHFVQGLAHTFPEWLLKRIFWGGFFPSHIMFFTNQQILFSKEKQVIISRAITEQIISLEDSKLWEQPFVTGWLRPIRPLRRSRLNEEIKQGVELSKLTFNRIQIFLADSSLGKRIEVAEAYYQFFRGTFTATFTAAIILFTEYWILTRSSTALEPHIGNSLLVGSAITLTLTFMFAWRARGSGQRYAREVVRAFDAARAIAPIKANDNQPNDQFNSQLEGGIL